MTETCGGVLDFSCCTNDTSYTTDISAAARSQGIYHERQVRSLCGMHAVNNMLQKTAFEPAELLTIEEDLERQQECLEPLSFAKIMRYMYKCRGASDFSVQAIELALQAQGLCLNWFDRRHGLSRLELDDPSLVGVIVNVEGETKQDYFTTETERHWFSVRRFADDVFYNLDSLLTDPERLGDIAETTRWLEGELADEGSLVFRVTKAAGFSLEHANAGSLITATEASSKGYVVSVS